RAPRESPRLRQLWFRKEHVRTGPCHAGRLGTPRLGLDRLGVRQARLRRLCRLHRSQLHRERKRDLSARVHSALRLSHHQHPTGGDDSSHWPVPHGSGRRRESETEGKKRFSDWVRVVVSPFPFDDDATFLSVSKHAAILFKKGIPEEVHIEDVMQVNGQSGTWPGLRAWC